MSATTPSHAADSLGPRALKSFQDMPPLQGFSRISFARHLPMRGPPGWALLLAGASTIGIGLWLSGRGNRIKWELKREKLQSRYCVEPFLEAEKDRFHLRAKAESDALEAMVMKDQPEWQLHQSSFHSKKYYPEMMALVKDAKRPVYPTLVNANERG